MSSISLLILITLLASLCNVSTCEGGIRPKTASFSREQMRGIADNFSSTMESIGYDVREGHMRFSTSKQCAVRIFRGHDCKYPQSVTPYSTYVLPFLDGEYIPNDGTNDERYLSMHRIRGDEAIVLIAKTPPESAYMGYTHYIGFRRVPTSNGTLEQIDVYGALSDTLNPWTINLDRPIHGVYEDYFDKDVVIVTTPHRDVYDTIKKTLIQEGVSSKIINLQPISPELFKWGLGEEADNLQFINRFSFPNNETEGIAYMEDPGAIVFRVTPKVEMIVTDPYERPLRAEQETDTNEMYLEETLDALEKSVLKTYHPYSKLGGIVTNYEGMTKGDKCILNNENCGGVTTDCNYFGGVGLYPMNDEQFYVIVGVNHMKSNTGGKFNSVSVYNKGEGAFAAFESVHDMEGSANPYLDDSYEHRDSLYAFTMRRDCTGYKHCVEARYGIFGLESDEQPFFVFRTYLDHHGPVGAPYESLLKDKVIFVNTTLDVNTPTLDEK